MDKMRMESLDITAQNVERIGGGCFLTVSQRRLMKMER